MKTASERLQSPSFEAAPGKRIHNGARRRTWIEEEIVLEESERLVSAKCRVCNKQLSTTEFRACSGVGHYCSAHLPASSTRSRPAPSRRSSGSRPPAAEGGRRNRRFTESGGVVYPCKAQFASDGAIRRGRLTVEHSASSDGSAVFVIDDIPYTATEIVTLFISDPDGRRLALRSGFNCHD